MRDRVYRRYQKARIKKRLIVRAIDSGNYPEPTTHNVDEPPGKGYWSIRNILRNEGKSRKRYYKCYSSRCEWCIGNLLYSAKKRLGAMLTDQQCWQAGDYLP